MSPPIGIEALPNDQWIVAGDTHLGAWAKQHGTIVTDPNLFRWLKPYIDEVEVVWDIGANIGDHARQYLDWGKQVVAFEPHPVTHRCLTHNCPEATCFNLAASDKESSLNFMALDNVGASRVHPEGEWSVPAMALDDIPGLPAPGFVKIDVEAWEPKALEGMKNTVSRHRPIIFCEFNKGALENNGFSVGGLRAQIEAFGYVATGLYPPKATWDDEQFDVLWMPSA